MRFYRELPTKDGEQLFIVTFTGTYYSSDPRDSGTWPFTNKWLIMARDSKTAIQKAEPKVLASLNYYQVKRETTRIRAVPFPLEDFIAAIDTSDVLHASHPCVKAELALEADQQKYRLIVCLAEK